MVSHGLPAREPAWPPQPSVRSPQHPPDEDQDTSGIRSWPDDQVPARPAVVLDGRHGAAVRPGTNGGDDGGGHCRQRREQDQRFPAESDDDPRPRGRQAQDRDTRDGREREQSLGFGGSGAIWAGISGSMARNAESGTAAATGRAIRVRSVQGRPRGQPQDGDRHDDVKQRQPDHGEHVRRSHVPLNRFGPWQRSRPSRIVVGEARRHQCAGRRDVDAVSRNRQAPPANRGSGLGGDQQALPRGIVRSEQVHSALTARLLVPERSPCSSVDGRRRVDDQRCSDDRVMREGSVRSSTAPRERTTTP